MPITEIRSVKEVNMIEVVYRRGPQGPYECGLEYEETHYFTRDGRDVGRIVQQTSDLHRDPKGPKGERAPSVSDEEMEKMIEFLGEVVRGDTRPLADCIDHTQAGGDPGKGGNAGP